MSILLIVIIFFLGSMVGSFLSVIIHRTRTGKKGILFGRSKCTKCQKKLNPKELIPLVSFLLLKGQCGKCNKDIDPHYFFIELMTGLLFAIFYIKFPFFDFTSGVNTFQQAFNPWLLFLFFNIAVIGSFLMLIFFYDLLYQEIPDIFSLPAILVAALHVWVTGEPSIESMLIGGAGAAIFFQGQIVISRGKWLGGGDVRLGILMGILLGWKALIVALFISYALGAGVSIFLLTTGQATRKTMIAFGPFLIAGTITALLFGNNIINWYLSALPVL